MSLWFIDPHDPLIFRDGKPFGPTPGAYAKSLPFPFPSTTTGGLRQLAALDKEGMFTIAKGDDDAFNALRQRAVRGPLLVRLAADGQDIDERQWLLPAPGDVLILPLKETDTSDRCRILQLRPIELGADEISDFTDDLKLVGLTGPSAGQKLHKKAPHYWDWPHFAQWLFQPESFCYQENSDSENSVPEKTFDVTSLGHGGPVPELRVHITMDQEKRVALDQHLFDTGGLEFTVMLRNDPPTDEADQETVKKVLSHSIKQLGEAQRLALAVIVDDDKKPIQAGLSTLGGERRIVSWRQSQAELPSYPDELVKQIYTDRRCRLILLTPAYFKQGYRPEPETLMMGLHDVKPVLEAIKIDRPHVVSGWDMQKDKRRASIRLAPAGTVMFLSFAEGTSRESIKRWIEATWLHCISDDLQYRSDGFGLAMVGTWSKEKVTHKEAEEKES